MSRLAAGLLALSLAAPAAHAGEQRAFDPIRRPDGRAREGAPVAAGEIVPVRTSTVREGVEALYAAWNSPDIEQHLADDFYDRTRLADAIDGEVPRDASLRVLSIGSIQTLDQHLSPDGRMRTSLVTVSVRAQVEYQDPAVGLVRREGTNELLLRVREEAR